MLKNIFILIILLVLTVINNVYSQSLPPVCGGDVARYGINGMLNSVFEWNVEGGEIVDNYNDSIDILWGSSSGIHQISVIEHTEYNCPSDPSYANIYISSPNPDLGVQQDICEGDSVIYDLSGLFESYLWHNGSHASSIIAKSTGYVWVNVVDDYGCVAIDSVWVEMHNLPEVNLGNDTAICDDNTLMLDAGYDGLSYNWSTGENSQSIIVYSGEQVYEVEVENEFGCVSIDSIRIIACLEYEEFKKGIPTAFTPNGDFFNDLWQIPGIEFYPEVEIEIFDRWGGRIFKSDVGYTKPWDGKSKGKDLPMDSYYYIINLKRDGLAKITGSVAIIR
jgi:gliding motility-associated-like protein